MTERILQKIGKVNDYLSVIEALAPDCDKKFNADPVYRGALLHYLYLTADTCVALAEAMIRLKGLRPPQSYHEAFDILGAAGVLPPDFAYGFASIAGFRNFLAHDYEAVDARGICREILTQLDDVVEYLRLIEAQATSR